VRRRSRPFHLAAQFLMLLGAVARHLPRIEDHDLFFE